MKPERSSNKESKTPMTVKEAAEYLRTTKSGLYAMVRRMQVPFTRLSKRKILFLQEDLLEHLEKNKQQPLR